MRRDEKVNAQAIIMCKKKGRHKLAGPRASKLESKKTKEVCPLAITSIILALSTISGFMMHKIYGRVREARHVKRERIVLSESG